MHNKWTLSYGRLVKEVRLASTNIIMGANLVKYIIFYQSYYCIMLFKHWILTSLGFSDMWRMLTDAKERTFKAQHTILSLKCSIIYVVVKQTYILSMLDCICIVCLRLGAACVRSADSALLTSCCWNIKILNLNFKYGLHM